MTEPYPVVERIAQALAGRLETITEANGYRVMVAEVIRPARLGIVVTPADYSIVMVQAPPEQVAMSETPVNPPVLAWSQTWWLDCYLRAGERVQPYDQLCNVFVAEVERCVLTGEASWAGLTYGETMIGSPDPLTETDGTPAGWTLPVTMTYQVLRTDPYEVA